MSQQSWIRLLHRANYVLGALVLFASIAKAIRLQTWTPLLFPLGVLIVGPFEDWLKNRYRTRPPAEEEPPVTIVDKATSAGLLALLLVVIWFVCWP